ncbi:calcium-binding tyrosine phosphorylation-regulated protein [Melanerpes formicivorus]|uniref:calcium-binding tyrosine phosphorylation-regulated protein n=1 Tax=Melanerpes formicivorus TaxID=211600 RepID=UPI00358E17E3
MQPLQTRLVVPYGLTALLEGVSRAAVVKHPEDIADFFTLYFQDLAAFRREHPDLDLTELIEQFELEFISENTSQGLEEQSSALLDAALPWEPKQRDESTDTEQDQLLPEPDIQYSSKCTQHPSSTSSLAESKSPPASDGAWTPVGAELAYVPAEPAALAAHVLGNDSPSLCSMRDVATSVQTLPTDSQPSEDELTPLEGASEAASAVSADESSVEDVGSQAGLECPPGEGAHEDASPAPAAKASAESFRSQTGLECPLGEGAHEDASSAPAAKASAEPFRSQAGLECPPGEGAREDASAPAAKASAEPFRSQAGLECPPGEGAHEDPSPAPAAKASAESFRSQAGLECPPGEGAREDASAPAAKASAEAVRSQPGSQADGPTNDVNQASEGPWWEEPSPSPAPKDPLQPLPSCTKAEVVTAEAVSQHCPEQPVVNVELPPYVEQFPQRILIPLADQTACLLETEQPSRAGQGLSVPPLVPSGLVTHPERVESAAHVGPAERACGFSATASREEPQAHPNVWTLYRLTALRQGQTPSLPCGQAPLSPAGGEAQQQAVQLAGGSAPVYVLQEPGAPGSAPPFILLGSSLQGAGAWQPLPSYAAFAQQGAAARGRFAAVPVPVARPAEEELDRASPCCSSAERTPAERRTPQVCAVAVPLPELMAAQMDPQAGVERRGCACKSSSGMDFPLQ